MVHGNNLTAGKMSVVCVFIFMILPTNLLGHILDTMCLTTSPDGEPVGSVTYLGIVSGFDEDAAMFYRRGASTRNYEKYSYPTIGNYSCNQTSSSEENISCGFFRQVQIGSVNQTEDDSPTSSDSVTLTDAETNEEEQRVLRFGVFQCRAAKYNFTETTTLIIMSRNAVFKPKSFTITVNLEDRVRLAMTPSPAVTAADIRWRHITRTGVIIKTEWRSNANPVIGKVSLNDAGVYEAYTMSSKEHYSGYTRLLVRGCRYNLWGHPASCEHTCPVCYNGGVCDDKSGRCFCPPGFTGDRCENACSRGFIGQRCDVECSEVSDYEDCRGTEICLPDPFGCSCAPGYKGLNCTEECAAGFYGAGCTQVCHCDDNTFCDIKTGLCSAGECESSWGGPMCQVTVLSIFGYGYPAVVNTGNKGPHSVYKALTKIQTESDTVELKVGREVETGSGATGSGVSSLYGSQNYSKDDTGLPYTDFPTISNMWGGGNIFSFRSDREDTESLGVFYVEGIYRQRKEHIPLVRMSNQASNVPQKITWTVGTGESVRLQLDSSTWSPSTLRWRHNGGKIIERANGKTYLTIMKARKADEGVYECFDETAEEKDKAIMLLKVRSCPSGKWGIYCNNTCPVCYYKGICHDETGECVCQAGYTGRSCSEICSSHGTFGPTCELLCGESGACQYTQICSPDPIGCHCRSGFRSERCHEYCGRRKFGPDCSMLAHCSSISDHVEGCSSDTCSYGYQGPGCQERNPHLQCISGLYGILCNYPCHCTSSYNVCDRTTGSCGRSGAEGCAAGWGGNNCNDALPALMEAPIFHIIDDELIILWNLWRPGVDYGTGPVKSYVVKYERDALSCSSCSVNVTGYSTLLEGLDPREVFSISVAAVKDIGGIDVTGPDSPPISVLSPCGRPYFSPEINNTSSLDNADLFVRWQIEAPAKWMECFLSIRVFYRMTNNQQVEGYETKDYNATQGDIRLENLKPCKSYDVKLAVVYRNGKTSRNSSSETAVTNSSGIFPEITVQEKDVSPTTLTIMWQLRGEGDSEWSSIGDENQYKLILIMETPGGNTTTNTYDLTQQYHTAKDLETNTTYIFDVTVEDCAGRKGPRESLNITTKPPPTTPIPELVTQSLTPESSKPQPSESSIYPVVLPILLPLLFLLIVIVVFLFFMKRRNKQRPSARRKVENFSGAVNKSSEMMPVKLSADVPPSTEFVTPSLESMTPSTETEILYSNLASDAFCIALENLHNYVQSKKLETDGFKKEFEVKQAFCLSLVNLYPM
ncbi:Angiopoietin-1 receptor [Holothuria leucospilota]|uniref:Angiopoietin-1 receptor n=1 Tax=Holothuria leucospilota TaxID=206669 RepID=A0A9Q1C954_HOLLE|nr:Angiopoietin-1 receptor [Holothuria leucospilota]